MEELSKRVFEELGLEPGNHRAAWEQVAPLLAALDAVGRSGANALVKIDGDREGDDVYTVVISGGPLGEEFFRKDGPELAPLLSEGLAFYLKRQQG